MQWLDARRTGGRPPVRIETGTQVGPNHRRWGRTGGRPPVRIETGRLLSHTYRAVRSRTGGRPPVRIETRTVSVGLEAYIRVAPGGDLRCGLKPGLVGHDGGASTSAAVGRSPVPQVLAHRCLSAVCRGQGERPVRIPIVRSLAASKRHLAYGRGGGKGWVSESGAAGPAGCRLAPPGLRPPSPLRGEGFSRSAGRRNYYGPSGHLSTQWGGR